MADQTIHIDDGGLSDDLAAFAEGLRSQKLLNTLGLAGIRSIRVRTRKGLDVNERPFPSAKSAEAGSPYSKVHRKRREAENLPTHLKNLEFTLYGGMLSKIAHVVASDLRSVAILIEDPEKAKLADILSNQGAGRGKLKHEFWGLNERETDAIQALVGEHINDLLRVTNLGG